MTSWNDADEAETRSGAAFESTGKLGGNFSGKGDGDRVRSGASGCVAVWRSDSNVACMVRPRERRRRGEMWLLGLAGEPVARTGAASDADMRVASRRPGDRVAHMTRAREGARRRRNPETLKKPKLDGEALGESEARLVNGDARVEDEVRDVRKHRKSGVERRPVCTRASDGRGRTDGDGAVMKLGEGGRVEMLDGRGARDCDGERAKA